MDTTTKHVRAAVAASVFLTGLASQPARAALVAHYTFDDLTNGIKNLLRRIDVRPERV